MAESEHSSLYPIAVLIDELRSDDLSRRLNSISNLRTISIALGPERTRNELIPYLSELIDDEEQFLLALADILSTMVDCVGGRNYAHILFEPLEQLCQVEESSVRLAAITSFKSIFLQVDMTILEPVIEDMIRRINEGEFFTGKCGVAMLIPICIENMTLATQRKFLEIFKDILNNNQPQVRKSGAESLKLISNLYVTHETVLIECLKIIASDKEDTVRLLTVDNFISFCKIVPESRINPIFIPILRSLLEDKSWRIRYMICDKIKEVGNILSIENRISLLCPFYIKFLQDQESEVRTTACNRLAEFCVLLPVEQTASIILPNLSPLVTDVDSVKTALASVINQLCQVIGKEYTEEHLIKILIELAKDQSAEIRMCLFKDIDKLSEIVGNDALSGFVVAAIQDLSEDKQWRIKIKTVECIASLGKQLGQEFFNTHLDNIMKKLLNDSVFSVRESAINTLNDLGHLFGNIWAEKKILEEIETGKNSESYLRRMTTIFVVKSMLEFISDDQIITSIIPLIALFSSDSVSNVRLNVSKLIKEVNPLLKDTQSKDQLKSLLQLLVKDEDIDVKYYSEIALKAIT